MLVVCCISGPSGSGKSTLARKVADTISAGDDDDAVATSVRVVSQDSYFTEPFVPYPQRKDDSFENGHGIDWGRMIQDMKDQVSTMSSSGNGKTGMKHAADVKNRGPQLVVLIVEGHILGNATEQLFHAFGHCTRMILVYLDCPPATCKARRLGRREDRTAEEMQVLSTYIDNYTNPCFVRYGLPAMQHMQEYAESSTACTMNLFLSTEDQRTQQSNLERVMRAIRDSTPGRREDDRRPFERL